MHLLLLLACADDGTTAVTLGQIRPTTPTRVLAGDWALDFGKDPDADLGPMAVIADEDGLAVLDQENQRILRYDRDGDARGSVAIPSRTTFDAVRRDDGWMLLAYDRDTISGSTQGLDDAGVVGGESKVPHEVDAPSAVFVDGDSVLVEQAHGDTIDVATGTHYPGRPTGDGHFVRAEKESSERLVISWSDGARTVRKTILTPDRPLGNVVALETRGGVTLVTLFLFEEGPAPDYDMIDPELRTVLLDGSGRRIDEISFGPGVETVVSREITLGPDGNLWRMRTDARDGLSIDRFGLELP